ncbi:NAD(P)H-binding protein [Streptomyces sp. NBC_01433]|uniref:NAD(P)H-binding protein n=1 Tax=Streptomyces sp. NBC_01433 TaxID=2903864 RepID=UPI00225464EA|nr:NAD(P)H-binding protein [Streptomyces sp. NBC_01433]MCX4676110.1 NAD(P)H-binding protein [Streptomyces sp. NBC_01433]
MILVTGATGNIGRELLAQLRAHGDLSVRGLTRDARRASFPEGVDVAEGDLRDAASMKSALNGVRSLVLLAGRGADLTVLDAARRAGVEHVVLVSSITVTSHPHLPEARANLEMERLLVTSGMDRTVLRPTQFASNTLWWAESVRERGVVRVPYADVGLPAIHPADIAGAARVALTDPAHRGRTHLLTGPERISPRRQVLDLATVLGRDLECVEISREEAHGQLAAALGDGSANSVLDLMGGDVNEELLAVRDTVALVTGQPARTFRQWATENAAAFR